MKDETRRNTTRLCADPQPWPFPPDTKCIRDEEYADIDVIDLSAFREYEREASGALLSKDEIEAQQDMIARTLRALRSTGILAIKGNGLSTQDIHRQFALGRLLHYDVPEEEKYRLHAQIITEGSWAGYKPQGYHHNGSYDYLEHYGFYPFTAIESCLPIAAKPYLNDFREFIEHNHYVLLRKILAIMSLGLGLERDDLWKLHHRGEVDDGALRGPPDAVKWKHNKDHLRYAVYHPPSEEDRKKKNYVWFARHIDLSSVTFLYSQPVAGLQILVQGDQWRYVRHYPDHIIVQLGASMECLTGGVLKAVPHRVSEPPEDQRHLDRPGIFFFAPLLPDVKLAMLDHPSLRALGGKDMFEEYHKCGGKPMTANEWHVRRSKLVGTIGHIQRSLLNR